MASCVAHLSLSVLVSGGKGGSQSHHVKANGLSAKKLSSICKTSVLTVQKKSSRSGKFSVSARYGDEGSKRGSGGGGDFIAGFLLGGAVFGAVAYIFAPQMEDNDKSPSPKDYYKILEVDYDATEELIRLNYRKLALKWHPDKHKGDSAATERFIEINDAYNVLMDPDARFEYDLTGIYEIHKYTLREYLARFKGMILTCNGLGISQSSSLCLFSSLKNLSTAGHINCLRPPTKQQQTSKVGFLFIVYLFLLTWIHF
ncbi:unnamed protein product [Brassica napus]|uniref:(rape) hypothetical protein n=1 Tax=Brassica napus TaxID=3708 RepID=A0A816I6C3_BRANA|nr:unnamed protein product [Brassica napus]